MIRPGAVLLGLALAVLPLASQAQQADPAEAARAAARMIEQATLSMQGATTAQDRVAALTEAVQAYEAGLAAMRDGLRRAALQEANLTARLAAREDDVAQLLGVLQSIGTAPPPVLMLHPSGALGAARSGMIMADVAPGLEAQAQALREDLEEVRTLRILQENAARQLSEGLAGIQQARAALSQAIADRTDLPRRFTADPVRTAILIGSTETLDGFASGLSEMTEGDIPRSNADITGLKGELPLPVQGLLLHRAGAADAAGVTREGILVATRPRALVVSPTAATIRYLGPLLDLGNVAILEPQADTLFVLSGLDQVFGEAGQVLPPGTPVGLMGGSDPETGEIVSRGGEGSGNERTETLYIEVRENGQPVDPESWFRTEQDG
ncbi:murein hydrolase activator EnvC family protein [Marinibacterium profundimaris]|uniref:Peptidase M23B n=1 Tax=Marinibacterium profundimaris TaxID=1679460 RepID=A0A225NSJ9_9RHOB|nr:peptidoglycan DD-metalloendopeptidase family protein [Marinibacterium profundimaris]OWU76007.1 peptidase M23B [Marinibacterium profundimaris]